MDRALAFLGLDDDDAVDALGLDDDATGGGEACRRCASAISRIRSLGLRTRPDMAVGWEGRSAGCSRVECGRAARLRILRRAERTARGTQTNDGAVLRPVDRARRLFAARPRLHRRQTSARGADGQTRRLQAL